MWVSELIAVAQGSAATNLFPHAVWTTIDDSALTTHGHIAIVRDRALPFTVLYDARSQVANITKNHPRYIQTDLLRGHFERWAAQDIDTTPLATGDLIEVAAATGGYDVLFADEVAYDEVTEVLRRFSRGYPGSDVAHVDSDRAEIATSLTLEALRNALVRHLEDIRR